MFLCIFRAATTLKSAFPLLMTRNLNQTSHGPLQLSGIITRNHAKLYIRNFHTNIRRTLQKEKSEIVKNVEKGKVAKLNKSEVRRLLSLAKPEKWRLTGALGLLLISSAVTMTIPFALGKIIDIIYNVEGDERDKNLKKVSLVLVAIFVVGALCNFGRTYLMQISGQRITQAMRTSVFGSIMRQEMAFFDKRQTGELVNRLSADTSLVSQCVTSNIGDGLRSVTLVGAGVSMMFYMSPQLALVGLTVVPPVAAMAIAYGRYTRKISKNVQDALADATQVAEERMANVRTVRAFGRELSEIATYENRTSQVLHLAYKEAWARGSFFALTGLSGNAIILTVLYYGGSMVTSSQITVGALSSFLLYAAYVGISLSGVSSAYSDLMKGLGASTRLWEIIDCKPAIPISGGLVPAQGLQGNLAFQNVTFAYPNRPNAPIFKDLCLSVPSGRVLAVVGASGSGKSTLASLLLRLYEPQSGQVAVDGTDIRLLDPQWLRHNVGTVSQEPALFSCSIKENILYGAKDPKAVTEKQLLQVARESNALNFINQFPDGFDTLVGERGIMLSGGQKQRIAIARALLKDPRVLLLDEATSALDAESEFLVQEALERLMKGRTVITIAHRLSTIRNADEIAVLHEGRIAEKGSYDELMSLDHGIFRRLVERQAIALS